MVVTLCTLIQADVHTPNGNIYPKEVLEKLVEDTNRRIAEGAQIYLRKDIFSEHVSSVQGIVKNARLDQNNNLLVTVDILPISGAPSLLELSRHARLNTQILVEDGDTEKKDKLTVVKKGTLQAVSLCVG